jgi:hypothetical protein
VSGRPKRTQVDEDADALRLLIREAHEATKDLKAVIREATEARESLITMAAVTVEQGINIAVEEGLKAYSESISTAIDDATDAVYERFDVIAATLLGESEKQKRRGDIRVVDQAALLRKIVQGANPDDLTDEELSAVRAIQTNRRNR